MTDEEIAQYNAKCRAFRDEYIALCEKHGCHVYVEFLHEPVQPVRLRLRVDLGYAPWTGHDHYPMTTEEVEAEDQATVDV